MRKSVSLPFLTRCSALALAAVLALQILPGSTELAEVWRWTALVVPAISPYLAVCSAMATRTVGIATMVGLPVLVIVALKRRWFCRYVCPVGLLVDTVGRFTPSARTRGAQLPPLGEWVALLTLGGALVGYPLLLWMDPMAMLSGFLGLFRQGINAASIVSALGLPIVLLITIWAPAAWCGRICPLGATQDLLGRLGQFIRKQKRVEEPKPAEEASGLLVRRSVLAIGLGALWAFATMRVAWVERAKPIRPPGAIDERRFTGVCVRCGNCVRACPAGIIRPDLGRLGIGGFLSPVVSFENNYCLEDCRRCTEVCPSGAVRRLSLEEKRKTAMGVAWVNMSLCLLSENQECNVCASHCPYEAITIAFNEKHYTSTPQIAREKCPGCGACEVACPTRPKAIRVTAR